MTSSFFNFSNIDLVQYDAFDQNLSYGGQNYPQFNPKDANCISTQDPSVEMFNTASRSKKTCLNPFESSFQCNFQYEHLEACDKKIQNFMEAISSCSEKIQKQSLRNRILQTEMNSITSCEEILDSQNCQIQWNEKEKLKVDLRYEKKLKEFLDQICKKFVPEIAGEFLAVADFIWLKYMNVMEERFSQSELINWAKNLVQTKFKEYRRLLEKTKEICFQDDQSQVFPNFDEAVKEFMNYFFVTVVLVIEQCFENPFFQEEKSETKSFKRASSEEDYYSYDQISELQEDIYGCKKLKF